MGPTTASRMRFDPSVSSAVCALCVWEGSILFACWGSEARTSKEEKKKTPRDGGGGDRGQGVALAEGNAQGLAGLGLQELSRGRRLSALHGCQQARGDGAANYLTGA